MNTDNRYHWPHKDLLDVTQLSGEDALHVLDLAASFQEINRRPIKKVPTLKGKTVVLFFVENSTRTKTSFDVAGKRLSADTYSLSKSGSSLNKGESLKDTALTLQAMGPDVIVIRHSSSGAAAFVADLLPCGIVNGGDGWHAHPTQALLDCFSLRETWGDTFAGRNLLILGDIAHSRVAARMCTCSTCSASRSGSARRARCCPQAWKAGPWRSFPSSAAPCAMWTRSCACGCNWNASRPGSCRIWPNTRGASASARHIWPWPSQRPKCCTPAR